LIKDTDTLCITSYHPLCGPQSVASSELLSVSISQCYLLQTRFLCLIAL